MNSPNPLPPPGWAPTNSTYASVVGGAAAVFISLTLASFGHVMGDAWTAALTTLLSAGAGFLFSGGRK